MIRSLFLQKVPIEKGRDRLLVTRLALSSHFMYYLIVCTMKPMLLCALYSLSMQSPFFGIGSAVIMYLSKYSVLSLMHMKLLMSLVLVRYFFLCFAPKKVLKTSK